MEHRDKRQRFNESEHPVCNPDTKIPSTESVLAPSTTTEGSVAPVPTARGSASPVPEGLVVAISKTSVAPISGVPEPTSQTVEEPSTPLTSDTIRTSDTSTWQGWAEIENDPAIFNIILREWGVQGIQVNEVYDLSVLIDPLNPSPPVYGLIFLSRYSAGKKGQENIQIPQELWFANQISTYSCGTVALMNIISNVENIDLGPELSHFVTSTSNKSSKDKGLALDSFEHVREVHNSFATIIDMKAVDRRLHLDAKSFIQRQKQAAKAKSAPSSKWGRQPARRSKNKKQGKTKKHPRASPSDEDEESEAGYHFIAYVPARGHLWRMDGLQREPESLGTLSHSSNWLSMAVAELSAQIKNAAENEIQFSIMSLAAAGMEEERASERVRREAERMREDWGPLLAEVVRMVAETRTGSE